MYSEIPDLDRASVLIVGAGDTGSLVGRLLAKRGVGRIVIANRTLRDGTGGSLFTRGHSRATLRTCCGDR